MYLTEDQRTDTGQISCHATETYFQKAQRLLLWAFLSLVLQIHSTKWGSSFEKYYIHLHTQLPNSSKSECTSQICLILNSQCQSAGSLGHISLPVLLVVLLGCCHMHIASVNSCQYRPGWSGKPMPAAHTNTTRQNFVLHCHRQTICTYAGMPKLLKCKWRGGGGHETVQLAWLRMGSPYSTPGCVGQHTNAVNQLFVARVMLSQCFSPCWCHTKKLNLRHQSLPNQLLILCTMELHIQMHFKFIQI